MSALIKHKPQFCQAFGYPRWPVLRVLGGLDHTEDAKSIEVLLSDVGSKSQRQKTTYLSQDKFRKYSYPTSSPVQVSHERYAGEWLGVVCSFYHL